MPSQRADLPTSLFSEELRSEDDSSSGDSVTATSPAVSFLFLTPGDFVEGAAPSNQPIRIETVLRLSDAVEQVAVTRPDLLLIHAAALAACAASQSLYLFRAFHADRSTHAESLGLGERLDASSSGEAPGIAVDALAAAIEALRRQDRQLPILVMLPVTVDLGRAVSQALEAGATDVVSEAAEPHCLGDKAIGAVQRRRLHKRPTVRIHQPVLEPNGSSEFSFTPIVGGCGAMIDALCSGARIVEARLPLLIHGEPGTDKSLIAKSLHHRCARETVQVIDCGQFANGDAAQALFDDKGHGIRLLQDCHNGMLIIENIDYACDRTQRKLLAILNRESWSSGFSLPGRFSDSSAASGDDAPRLVLTCSTVTDPQQVYPGGYSRIDRTLPRIIPELYYKLSGHSIEIPPLRDRGQDLELLIKHFVATASGTAPVDSGSGDHRLTADAKAKLLAYDWPGNVSQLRGIILSEFVQGSGAISLTSRLTRLLRAPARPAQPSLELEKLTASPQHRSQRSSPPLDSPQVWAAAVEHAVTGGSDADENSTLYGDVIQAVEGGLISAVLEKTEGNLAQSARLLGITRVSLRRKIHSLGLQIPGRSTVE
jgi:DNA-binding NtrC family response regulator